MEERMTLTNSQTPKMARLKIPERRNKRTRQATKNRSWYRVIRVTTTSNLVTGADWHWRSDRHGAMSNVALTLTRSRHGEEYLPHSGASARAVLLTYRWSTVSGWNLSHKILDLFFKRKPFSLTRVESSCDQGCYLLFFGFEWTTTHILGKWLRQADHVMDEISRSL